MSCYEHGKLVGKSIGYGDGYQEGYKKGRADVIAELESLGIFVPDSIKSVTKVISVWKKNVEDSGYEDEVDSGYEAN